MLEYSYVDFLIGVAKCLDKAKGEDHIYLMSRLLSDHLSQRYTDDASFEENLGIAIGYMLQERENCLERARRMQELADMIKENDMEIPNDWWVSPDES
jgi:hypothetical protein